MKIQKEIIIASLFDDNKIKTFTKSDLAQIKGGSDGVSDPYHFDYLVESDDD